jgi:hypothetical protein
MSFTNRQALLFTQLVEEYPVTCINQFRKGKVEVRFFNDAKEFISKTIIQTGDVLMLVSGGHGFTMLEDTILLEIKQGPYTGLVEKERFDDPS